MKCTYSSRLKAPDKSIDVNMEKLAVVRMMKALCRAKQKEITQEWMKARGVVLEKKEYPGMDDTAIPVFILSPAEAEEAAKCASDIRSGKAQRKMPAMVYLHGGAYALPVQQSALELAAVYAKQLGGRVFVPEYRLLPEYSGEIIFKDCLRLWEWLFDSGHAEEFSLDRERTLLYGESAGGALAAGVALYQRDRQKKMPQGLFLIYPVLDNEKNYASKIAYTDAAWSDRSNDSMWRACLSGVSEEWVRYLIPMKHPTLAGLPPVYIEPQEYDILRDEAQAFAGRLKEESVMCRCNLVRGSYHSFDMDLSSPLVQEVLAQRISEMKKI